MGKHEIALSYIEKATIIMQNEYERRYPDNMGEGEERTGFAAAVASTFLNAGVEYEHAYDFSSSLIYLNKALRISELHLGKFAALT